MKIVLNGKPRDIAASRLDLIVEELGHGPKFVATAVNGDFVPIAARPQTTLCEDDRLEVLAPMQGG